MPGDDADPARSAIGPILLRWVLLHCGVRTMRLMVAQQPEPLVDVSIRAGARFERGTLFERPAMSAA
jgi:hypothetical protein